VAGFKAFHGEFYHPSNARVFFYGDDPVPARLTLLDSYVVLRESHEDIFGLAHEQRPTASFC
jgi:Zn-dependent M16 (insulinase) family peptidase